MNTTNTISTWTDIINQFFHIFTAPGAKIFARLLEGWILCTVRRTVTGILPFADPANERAHDAYHRFFPDARWNMAKLWQVLTKILIQTFCRNGTITLALDDTLFHRSGRNLGPKRRKKKRGRPRTKGRRLAKLEKMASHIQNWQTVTFRQRGKTVKRLVYTRVVLWYTVSRKPIMLVISRDPNGKEKDDFFFTTDVTMDPAEVLGCYADRWAIEDTFKNTKQLLGSQQPQTYKGKGPERAAGLSLWLYSTVWLWYLKQKSRKRYFIVQPWYRQKLTPSFADALSCLRRELWQERIKCMFGVSAVHDKKLKFLLEALAPAA